MRNLSFLLNGQAEINHMMVKLVGLIGFKVSEKLASESIWGIFYI